MSAFYAWLSELARAGTIPAIFEFPFITRGMIAAVILAPLLGGMSHIVVARRLAFLSAALGHAALTGLTIGLVLGEPLDAAWGGLFGFCLLSGLGMVYVRRRASLPPDTLIGVFLALTLGLGICLLVAVTQRFNVHQIEAVMFGSLITVTDTDLLILLVTGLLVSAVFMRIYNALLLDTLSPSIAAARRVPSAVLDYVIVMLLTLVIVVSLKIVGAFLVESLILVPAAAARNLARSVRGYFWWSIAIAFVATEAGLIVSTVLPVPSGGAIVLVLAAIFFVALIASRLRPR